MPFYSSGKNYCKILQNPEYDRVTYERLQDVASHGNLPGGCPFPVGVSITSRHSNSPF